MAPLVLAASPKVSHEHRQSVHLHLRRRGSPTPPRQSLSLADVGDYLAGLILGWAYIALSHYYDGTDEKYTTWSYP